jgi:hypothetical protein
VIADLLLIACLAAVAIGAGLVYLPAGLIVGGLLGAGTVLAEMRGRGVAG